MAQVRADIEDKQAGTAYKVATGRSEPYWIFTAILGATAAIVPGVFGALGYMLGKGH